MVVVVVVVQGTAINGTFPHIFEHDDHRSTSSSNLKNYFTTV